MPLFAQACILLSFCGTRDVVSISMVMIVEQCAVMCLSHMASALQQQSFCSQAMVCGSALAIVLIATVDPALDSEHGSRVFWVKCYCALVPPCQSGTCKGLV